MEKDTTGNYFRLNASVVFFVRGVAFGLRPVFFLPVKEGYGVFSNMLSVYAYIVSAGS